MVLARGITINGLPIMIHSDYLGGYSIPNLDVYYEDCVIGGPGAFLLTVESIDRIAEAIRRKLVLEIAGTPPRIMPAQLRDRARAAHRLPDRRKAQAAVDGPVGRSRALARSGQPRPTRRPDWRRASAPGSRRAPRRSGFPDCPLPSAAAGFGLPSAPSAGAMRSATSSPILVGPGSVAAGMRGCEAAGARQISLPPSSCVSPAIRCRSRVASATTAADCSGDSAAIWRARVGSGTTLPPICGADGASAARSSLDALTVTARGSFASSSSKGTGDPGCSPSRARRLSFSERSAVSASRRWSARMRRLVERLLGARAALGLELQRMLGGAERGAGLGVPPLQILDHLALAGEPPLDVEEVFLVGDELGARIHEVALLQVGFEPMRGRHVEDAADLALEPVHLHGMARPQFVPLGLELGPSHRDPGQQPPLGEAPRATHEGDREGEPDQPAHEDAEGEDHSRLDHDGSATPPS